MTETAALPVRWTGARLRGLRPRTDVGALLKGNVMNSESKPDNAEIGISHRALETFPHRARHMGDRRMDVGRN